MLEEVIDKISVGYHRLHEKLWVKPLMMCLLSLISIHVANLLEQVEFFQAIPTVSVDSVVTLLSVLTAGMLAIATFPVGAMVNAYHAASTSATPRSFSAVLSKDSSQNALSVFIGTFIYSVVGLIFIQNGFLNETGVTLLFWFTVVAYAMVIYSFVRWLDWIARLGQLGTTIRNEENTTLRAIKRRSISPYIKTIPADVIEELDYSASVYSDHVGYVTRIDIPLLQQVAKEKGVWIGSEVRPGDYVGLNTVLCKAWSQHPMPEEFSRSQIMKAFQVQRDRHFDDDPLFGIVVITEIGNRALSPGINDPGTAIEVLSSHHRLISKWATYQGKYRNAKMAYDRVYVPRIQTSEILDAAFNSLGRDGAGLIEVAIRIQKTLGSLSRLGGDDYYQAALRQSELALGRALQELRFEPDRERVQALWKSTFAAEGADSASPHRSKQTGSPN